MQHNIPNEVWQFNPIQKTIYWAPAMLQTNIFLDLNYISINAP